MTFSPVAPNRRLSELREAIASDRVEVALPALTLSREPKRRWQPVAPSLSLPICCRCSAAAHIRFCFLAAVIPLLSGEHPKAAAIEVWLR